MSRAVRGLAQTAAAHCRCVAGGVDLSNATRQPFEHTKRQSGKSRETELAPLLKLHWGPPKLSGRLSFTHGSFKRRVDDGPVETVKVAPFVKDWPIQSWYGVAILNRLFVGIIRLQREQ